MFGLVKKVQTVTKLTNNFQKIPCSLGCGRKINEKDLENHIQNDCTERMTTCPHIGCTEEIIFSNLPSHMKYSCRKKGNGMIKDMDEWSLESQEELMECRKKCGLQVPIKTWRNHEKLECLEREVHCNLHGCKQKMKARHLQEHENECKNITPTCEYCGIKVERSFLSIHKAATCPEVKLCTCGLYIKHEDVKNHTLYECSARLISCKIDKCTAEFEARSQEFHEKICRARRWNCPDCNGWTHDYKQKTHLELECPERIVTCDECDDFEAEYYKLENHKKTECLGRLWTCPSCNKTMTYDKKDTHISTVDGTGNCKNHFILCKNGCGMYCTKKTSKKHYQDDCPNRFVNCSCGDILMQKNLIEHQRRECENRLLNCLQCKMPIVQKNMNKHMIDHCIHRPIICPLKCGRKIPHSVLENHITETCLNRIWECNRCHKKLSTHIKNGHIKSKCKAIECTRCVAPIYKSNRRHHFHHECPYRKVHCPRYIPPSKQELKELKELKKKKLQMEKEEEEKRKEEEIRQLEDRRNKKKQKPKRRFMTKNLTKIDENTSNNSEGNDTDSCATIKKYDHGCEMKIRAKDAHQHFTHECPVRLVSCPDCKEDVPVRDIELHTKTSCQEASTLCPLGCRQTIIRKHMEQHTTIDCKEIAWKCKCEKEVRLPYRHDHLKNCIVFRQTWKTLCTQLAVQYDKKKLYGKIQRIYQECCMTTPSSKITLEEVYCALAACHGRSKLAIINLQMNDYVTEMRLGNSVCNVAKYLRIQHNNSNNYKKPPNIQSSPSPSPSPSLISPIIPDSREIMIPEQEDEQEDDNKQNIKNVQALIEDIFKKIDINHDGSVSQIELIKALKKDTTGNIARLLGSDELAHGGIQHQEQGTTRNTFVQLFHDIDINNDKLITQVELIEYLLKLQKIQKNSKMKKNKKNNSSDHDQEKEKEEKEEKEEEEEASSLFLLPTDNSNNNSNNNNNVDVDDEKSVRFEISEEKEKGKEILLTVTAVGEI